MIRTETFKTSNERLIAEAERQIERSEKVLSTIRLREMGQQVLPGFEEVAKIIPFPQAPHIKNEVSDLTA